MKVHTSAKYVLFTTTNVAQRALAIVHTTTRLKLAAEKFIVVYKTVKYCTNIYICMFNKGTVFRQTYPLFKSWAMRSQRSGPWVLENIMDIYI